MTTTDPLLDRIGAADEAIVLEAGQLLAAALDAETPPTPASEVFSAPLEHRTEIVELCRLVLVVAATDPDTRELVDEALTGAGHKQLVLGGVEIAVIAALMLGALHVCISRGRTKSEEVITTKRRPDGSETTTVRRTVTYGMSAKIGDIVRSILGK